MFCLPQKVLKRIETICRSYLWSGSVSSNMALVAWDKVCNPLAAGGWNIMDIKAWNRAALCK